MRIVGIAPESPQVLLGLKIGRSRWLGAGVSHGGTLSRPLLERGRCAITPFVTYL